jgi:hypothetical protein
MSKRRPFLLYHWSPTKNRKSILHDGLCPGKKANLNGNEIPNPQYRHNCICFGLTPSAAWSLSAEIYGRRIPKRQEWDLWMVWSNVEKYTTTTGSPGRWQMTEYRIFDRIPKSKIWHVGTREFVPRKKPCPTST